MVSSSRIALALMLASSIPIAQAHVAPDTHLARSTARPDTRAPQPNPDPGRPAIPYVSSLNEGFDDITTLAGNGWFLQNSSAPVGSTSWFQGTSVAGGGPFDAFDGAANGYIGANYNGTGNTGTISEWMLTPELNFGANATLTFYTRKVSPDTYADRLEIRSSTAGASTNVGVGATATGDFTNLRLSINPSLVLGVYPTVWTQYTISGLPHSGSGRVAFRYFVTGGGYLGTSSDYIGIDRVQYTAGAAEYRIGGTVSGLAGSGLTLQLNGTDSLSIAADGSFTFPPYVTTGGAYAVTVTGQPSSLSQTCTVTNDTGTATATVTNVQVTCTTNTYAVGGSVTGLAGSGLGLQLGGQVLAVGANGNFAFPTALTDGSTYTVTVATQPTHLSQVCSVSNASGTLAGGAITNVQVTCATNSFSVGGTVSGLAGSGLVLQINGGGDMAISADGAFTFAPSMTDGSPYAVSVSTQPGNLSQTCAVTDGGGVLDGADVADITVVCTTNTYTVGGTVSGLAGNSLKLVLNNGDPQLIAANGSFAFPDALTDGTAYVVSVGTQPTTPNQTCTVQNASGTLAGANATDVTVTCTTNTYAVGGAVSGLAGSGLTLQINGGETLPIASNGVFAFLTPITDGTAYIVTPIGQPTSLDQVCTVGNGNGTMSGADVTNLQVTCVTNTYLIGGSVSGLAGSGLVLTLNGTDNVPVSANGGVLFPNAKADGSAYAVSVSTQPGTPSQTCTVANGSGTLAGSDITNIAVTCTTHANTMGGTVTGLDGTGLTLQLNGGNDLPIPADGAFTFSQTVADGATFAVTVSAQPTGGLSYRCVVRNGSGTMHDLPISDVDVICDFIFVDGFEGP
jgi:hypothetical protein